MHNPEKEEGKVAKRANQPKTISRVDALPPTVGGKVAKRANQPKTGGTGDWVARLLWLRAALGLDQKEFAERLSRPDALNAPLAQSTLSRYEKGVVPMPGAVTKVIEQLERSPEVQKYIKPFGTEDSADGPDGPDLESREFSYGETTFNRLKNEVPNQIEHMFGDFVVSRPKNGFADVHMELHLYGVTAPEPLYLDCLGVPPPLIRGEGNGYQFFPDQGSDLKLVAPKSAVAEVKEDERVRKAIGPHALGYTVTSKVGLGRIPAVSLTVEGARGLKTTEIDSVGVAAYADFLVERLSLRVRFERLRPVGLVPQVYLLRRTPLGSKPMSLEDPLQLRVLHESKSPEYTLTRLVRPKAGWAYCLAWERCSPG
jgi:transcriptional regulator with XRE-family HTH domain